MAPPATSSQTHWWRSADPTGGGVRLCLSRSQDSLISFYFAAERLKLMRWRQRRLLAVAVGGASASPTSQDVLLAKENDGAGETSSSATAAAAPDFPPKFFILQRLLARSLRQMVSREGERERAGE